MQKRTLSLLPIAGLSDEAKTLSSGGVYFALTQSFRWGELLVKSLSRQNDWLIVTSKPQSFSENDLRHLTSPPLKMPLLHKVRFQRILNDIRFYGDKQTQVVCFYLDACDWCQFTLEDQQRIIATTKKWSRKHHVACLFLLSEVEDSLEIKEQCHHYQSELTGLISVEGSISEGRWHVWHWYGFQQIIANKNYELYYENGQIIAKFLELEQDKASDIMDKDTVYCLRQAIFKEEMVPESWYVLSELTNILSGDTPLQAAYIILPYNYESPAGELTKLVFELRKALGPLVKIIIRETGARMRHADERIMLHFGATMVIPSNVSFSRFIGILESLRTISFDKHIGADEAFDLDSIINNNWVGYLQGTEFAIAVRLLRELSDKFGVQLTLIELVPAAGLTPKNIVNIGRFRRSGDICTVVQNAVYLCLFGCRDNDVTRALQFIFGLKIDHIVSRQRQHVDLDYIEHVIANFYLSGEEAFDAADGQPSIVGLEAKYNAASTHKDWENTLPAKQVGYQFYTKNKEQQS
jgi:cellulose biosynthesis protein BcsE